MAIDVRSASELESGKSRAAGFAFRRAARDERAALVLGRRDRGMIGGVSESEQPTETQLHLEKTLVVPQERVFAAFVDAEQLRRWWGPAAFTVPHLEFDAMERVDYRIAMQPPDGDVFHIRGTFRAVEPPRRLVFSFIYEEPDPDDQETLVTLTFDPTDTGTRVILDQGPFKTAARLELHREGWTDTLNRLDRSLV